MITRCRACNGDFFEEPLIKYENMPRIAQNLPDINTVNDDKGVDIEVCQCKFCGLVQLNSAPVPYYKEVIRSSGFSEEMGKFRHLQFKDFVASHSLENKKIIEIGCGKGEYLAIMQQYCNGTYGMEYSDESVRVCKEKGLNVFKGFVDTASLRLENAPYEAFFMMNFLEHLPDPNTVLRGICNNLGDEAYGLIEVPNFDMVLDKKIFADFSTEHIFYFTKNTLRKTLENNGFDVIGINVIWYENIIAAVVKKQKKLVIDDFISQKNILKTNVMNYLSRYGSNRVAIWGAGHQSLATIALLGLKDKIRYVVDSATFKQGKFTPATHLPIHGPEKLFSEPVDAVIIMATSYSDEVARILREKYPHIADVAILREDGMEIV